MFNCSLDKYEPERVFVLEEYKDHDVTNRIREAYSSVDFRVVDNQIIRREFECVGDAVDWGKKTLLLGRSQKFIARVKPQEVQHCTGPTTLTLISNGCSHRCKYCFLGGTYRAMYPRVKFNLNTEDMLRDLEKDIEEKRKSGITPVYNMGEKQDSLSFDPLYPVTKTLVPFFSEKDAKLLLLTKSDCVSNLTDMVDEHNENTIVSWSMNSDHVTRDEELDSATLDERIEAARKVQEAGYPIRLRFDPLLILPERDWREDYDDMMDKIFAQLNPERITLGYLRFSPTVKHVADSRFPGNDIFSSDLLCEKPQEDGRYRYRDEIIEELFRHIIDGIHERFGEVEIGLCKTTEEIWNSVGLTLDKRNPTCNCML